MKLIETHAHLEQIEDIDGAMKRATEAGITSVMAMSVDLESMKKTLALAKRFTQPRIYPALGVHPGLVKPEMFDECIQFIRDHVHEVQAIGETGLDYWYKWVRSDKEERAKQHRFFEAHLDIAREFNLPIVIHSRGAWRDCLAMTKTAGVKKALFHWYSGPVDKLEEILEAGYYVSTSISVGYSKESQTAMLQTPLDRILIETDSPVSYKEGEEFFKAEPRHVVLTLKHLARLKNIEPVQLADIVNSNASLFFGIKHES